MVRSFLWFIVFSLNFTYHFNFFLWFSSWKTVKMSLNQDKKMHQNLNISSKSIALHSLRTNFFSESQIIKKYNVSKFHKNLLRSFYDILSIMAKNIILRKMISKFRKFVSSLKLYTNSKAITSILIRVLKNKIISKCSDKTEV